MFIAFWERKKECIFSELFFRDAKSLERTPGHIEAYFRHSNLIQTIRERRRKMTEVGWWGPFPLSLVCEKKSKVQPWPGDGNNNWREPTGVKSRRLSRLKRSKGERTDKIHTRTEKGLKLISGGEVQIAPLGQGELVHRRDYARNVPFYWSIIFRGISSKSAKTYTS